MVQFLRIPQRSLYALSLSMALLIALFLAVGESAGQTGESGETPDQASQQPATPNQLQAAVQPSGTLPGNPSIQLVKVADGLIDPINVAAPNDGSGRIFVVERVGYIRIIQDGQMLEEPFLDIRDNMKVDHLEQGLLGLAFHPNYAENGRFFVYYTDWRTNGDSFVVEFSVSDDDPNRADAASARVLLTQDQPFVNHNGGTLRFGPDGYLYISMGDGGMAGDPYRNAQNLNTLLGSILRIDVDSETSQGYAIPEDNPFAGGVLYSSAANEEAQDGDYTPNARPEIWAHGLRNPWQFSFDRETGDLYIADVGQNEWEEINFQPADSPGGVNYGWPILEGSHCYLSEGCGVFGELPVAEFRNSTEEGCSITGIGTYRGDEFPSLDGVHFVSDYCSGKIWGLVRGENDEWHFAQLLQADLAVTSGGEDEAGNLYITACSCSSGRDYNPYANPGGTLWRIVAADQVPEGAETAPGSAGAAPEEEAPAPEEGTPTPTTSAEGGADPQATATPSPAPDEGAGGTGEGGAEGDEDTGGEGSAGGESDAGGDGDTEGEGTEQEGTEQEGAEQEGGDTTGAGPSSNDDLIAMGEQVYLSNCAMCHQPDGMGTSAYPALDGSEVLLAEDPTDALRIVINGRGQMPAFGNTLSDEEIAAVISHERTAWENDAAPVDVAQVQQVREGGSAIVEAGGSGDAGGSSGSDSESSGETNSGGGNGEGETAIATIDQEPDPQEMQAQETTGQTDSETASTSASVGSGTNESGSPAAQTLTVPVGSGASNGQEIVIRIVIAVTTPESSTP